MKKKLGTFIDHVRCFDKGIVWVGKYLWIGILWAGAIALVFGVIALMAFGFQELGPGMFLVILFCVLIWTLFIATVYEEW